MRTLAVVIAAVLVAVGIETWRGQAIVIVLNVAASPLPHCRIFNYQPTGRSAPMPIARPDTARLERMPVAPPKCVVGEANR